MATLAEVQAKLAKLGITVTVVRAYHATVRKGRVFRQDPPRTSKEILNRGSTMTVWVSKGKRP